VEGLSDRLYWAFHILEGTVFKLSNLSFAYLHGFYHFISFCLYLYRKAERKITACLYVEEGSEFRPFQIFDPFARPLTWGGDLKSGRVYFQTLFLDKISPQASKRPLLASHRAWSNALSGTLGPPRCSFLRNGSPSDDAQEGSISGCCASSSLWLPSIARGDLVASSPGFTPIAHHKQQQTRRRESRENQKEKTKLLSRAGVTAWTSALSARESPDSNLFSIESYISIAWIL